MIEIIDIPVKNFQPVTDWFYRGGQPDAEAIEKLAQAGFRTIISLRWRFNAIKTERNLSLLNGLNFYSIPLSYWILPSRKEIDHFLSILDDESKRPIYLHCLHGRDRTGMFTAIYRMARENWNADQAYAEMKAKGFRHIRMHQFKWAIYSFERRMKRLEKREHLIDNKSSAIENHDSEGSEKGQFITLETHQLEFEHHGNG